MSKLSFFTYLGQPIIQKEMTDHKKSILYALYDCKMHFKHFFCNTFFFFEMLEQRLVRKSRRRSIEISEYSDNGTMRCRNIEMSPVLFHYYTEVVVVVTILKRLPIVTWLEYNIYMIQLDILLRVMLIKNKSGLIPPNINRSQFLVTSMLLHQLWLF